ncbi:MAG: hypothetical protein JEZ05_11100 [Tenericutes bacterium]|nr:hypothetical protein [Mycoplasmatota bacterium]
MFWLVLINSQIIAAAINTVNGTCNSLGLTPVDHLKMDAINIYNNGVIKILIITIFLLES